MNKHAYSILQNVVSGIQQTKHVLVTIQDQIVKHYHHIQIIVVKML